MRTITRHPSLSPVALGVSLVGFAAQAALWLVQVFWVKMPHWFLYPAASVAALIFLLGIGLVIGGLRNRTEPEPRPSLGYSGSQRSELIMRDRASMEGYDQAFRTEDDSRVTLEDDVRVLRNQEEGSSPPRGGSSAEGDA
jgi:hypothetical protein